MYLYNNINNLSQKVTWSFFYFKFFYMRMKKSLTNFFIRGMMLFIEIEGEEKKQMRVSHGTRA